MEKLSNKIIAIGGAFAIIFAAFAFFVKLESPVEFMDKHIAAEEKAHATFDTKLDSVGKKVETISHVEDLLEGMLRGECLENPRENLARQGLLTKCKELGIER